MTIQGLEIDHNAALPVYRQIADGVLAALEDGRLERGARLPATRDLARELGVNRQTVVAAYEYLATEGRVVSHTGKGTFLIDRAAVSMAPGEHDPWLATFSRAVEGAAVGGLLSVYRNAHAVADISFAGSYPAREWMPVESFSQVIQELLAEQGADLLGYGPTAGYRPLQRLLAEQMRARGSAIEADNILITNGAQQAIELVFHTFLERGDSVVIEEPTYTGALSVLGSIGARAVAVPLDGEGMREDLAAIALERHRPRLMYLQPTFQNPTTVVMSEPRRRRLLELAARNRCIVVEDDWGAELSFEGQVPPTMHALEGGRHVIYLSTFSKKLLPGLRVGWLAAPDSVIERLMRLKQIRDCGTSSLLQAALHRFIEKGYLEQHLQKILPATRERRDCMMAAIGRHFPRGVRSSRPTGGLFCWVRLPRGFDGRGLFLAAEARGVRFGSGELFHTAGNGAHTLRLTYSTATPSEIERGIKILGELIRERWPTTERAVAAGPAAAMPIV